MTVTNDPQYYGDRNADIELAQELIDTAIILVNQDDPMHQEAAACATVALALFKRWED